MRPELINASVLAYLGDSIFEVLVRDYLVKESGFVKPNDLQREAVKYVSASSHAAFMHDMLDEEFFSADEVGTYKRGRNTKGSKNESLDRSSMIYLKDENIIFSGDVLFKGSIGRFDFPNSSKYETIESINKIKEYDFDAVIYPGHGPNSTLSEERLNNPYLKKS